MLLPNYNLCLLCLPKDITSSILPLFLLHQVSPAVDYFQRVIISIILKTTTLVTTYSPSATPSVLCLPHHRIFCQYLRSPIPLLLFSLTPTLVRGSLYCSPQIALSIVTNGLHIANSSGQVSVLVLLDQKAAFGITDPLLLLGTFPSLDFQDTTLSPLATPFSVFGWFLPIFLITQGWSVQGSVFWPLLDTPILVVISSSLVALIKHHLFTEPTDMFIFSLDFSPEL